MEIKIKWVKKFSNMTGTTRCLTHGRRFHADDMFATIILAYAYGNIEVMTTRKVLYEYDIMYDRGLGEYDHHQAGGNGQRDNGIPYAASGLIWKDYGQQVIRNITKNDSMNKKQIEYAWSIVDRELIQGIDASDNGYRVRVYANGYEPMSISKIVGILNYLEGCTDVENHELDQEQLDEISFYKIINVIQPIFHATIINAIERAMAIDQVIEKYKNTVGEILILDKKIPWQEGLFQIDTIRRIKYVILPSKNAGYKVKAVNKSHNSYEVERPFPESWWGLPTEELVRLTGISDMIFCHKGYVCGCGTLESALKIAEIALNLALAC